MKPVNAPRPFGTRFLEASVTVLPPDGDMIFTTSSTYGGGCEGLECDLSDDNDLASTSLI